MKKIIVDIKNNKTILIAYKAIMTFVIPALLFFIVGSVVTRNKPAPMQPALLASALADLVVLGFITNTFISLGVEYIRFKNENDWSSKHKKEIIYIIFKNILYGVFNFFYLFFIAWITSDVTHWMAPHLFYGEYSYNMDWLGIVYSMALSITLSVSFALLISQFIKKELIFAGLGLLYFLGFGYLAGGMFGPGATYWMVFPSLLMPHAYVAHFLQGALTNGHYVVPHIPSTYDIISIGNTEYPNELNLFKYLEGRLAPEQMKSIYVQENASIWNLSVFDMRQWSYVTYTLTIFGVHLHPEPAKLYNSFYQISVLNIFLPLVCVITSSAIWGYLFYIKK